jgi:hypothetical protein
MDRIPLDKIGELALDPARAKGRTASVLVTSVSGRSAIGWMIMAVAMTGLSSAHAQDAAPAGTLAVPNIKWSLSGKHSVTAAAPTSQPRPAMRQAPARKGAADAPTAKTSPKQQVTAKASLKQQTTTARASPKQRVATVKASSKQRMTTAKASQKPRVATANKPIVPLIVRHSPPARVAARPTARPATVETRKPAVTAPKAETHASRTPAPAARRIPQPAPLPAVIDEPDAGQVTIQPLTPRPPAATDDGSFGHAVAATAKNTVGLPALRLVTGLLSLAAALAGLAAIWWRSIGARHWHARRRGVQPRLMIDVALAEEPLANETPPREMALPRMDAA